MADEREVKLIHVQIVGGSQADIYDVGKAIQKLKEPGVLPFRLEAIVTNDQITLRDVDALLQDLFRLKKQLEQDKRMSGA